MAALDPTMKGLHRLQHDCTRKPFSHVPLKLPLVFHCSDFQPLYDHDKGVKPCTSVN